LHIVIDYGTFLRKYQKTTLRFKTLDCIGGIAQEDFPPAPMNPKPDQTKPAGISKSRSVSEEDGMSAVDVCDSPWQGSVTVVVANQHWGRVRKGRQVVACVVVGFAGLEMARPDQLRAVSAKDKDMVLGGICDAA
jgi:hypothetical protein